MLPKDGAHDTSYLKEQMSRMESRNKPWNLVHPHRDRAVTG